MLERDREREMSMCLCEREEKRESRVEMVENQFWSDHWLAPLARYFWRHRRDPVDLILLSVRNAMQCKFYISYFGLIILSLRPNLE